MFAVLDYFSNISSVKVLNDFTFTVVTVVMIRVSNQNPSLYIQIYFDDCYSEYI